VIQRLLDPVKALFAVTRGFVIWAIFLIVLQFASIRVGAWFPWNYCSDGKLEQRSTDRALPLG
jgi:hypothetical protein